MTARFISRKTYGHNQGLSVAFRQWRADSHCRFLHGYALAVTLEFAADDLDDRGWVVDFGDLKEIKVWLQDMFDHKTVIAADDPELEWFKQAAERGVLDLKIVDAVGCEAFAQMIFTYVQSWLEKSPYHPRCRLQRVAVAEHEGNGAAIAI